MDDNIMTRDQQIAGRIMRNDSYNLRQFHGDTIKTFLDIGANVGTTSIMARVLFPQARIVALEPGPEAFKRLSFFKDWLIECTQVALGDGSDLCFHDRGHLGINRMYHKSEPWWMPDAPMIKSMTLPTMMDTFKITAPYIIKVDCEGGERFLLSDAGVIDIVRGCVHFAIEIHYGMGGTPDQWRDFFAQFRDTHTLRRKSGGEWVENWNPGASDRGRYEVVLTANPPNNGIG